MSAISRNSWRPFLAVEGATALAGTGNGITTVALPWLVLERTGSATAAGVLAAITTGPAMVAALLSGTIIDRVGRRAVSIGSDLFSLVSVALIPLVDTVWGLGYPLLVALAVLGAVFDPAGAGAREAMLPESSRAAGITLAKANGINEAVWGAAFVAGPAVGGLLIALVGPAATFWATAGMFLASAAVMAAVRVPGGGRPTAPHVEGFWASTGTGISFVWHQPLLRTVALMVMALVGLWLPIEGVILPVHFEALDQPESLGLVLVAMSVGGILGALGYGWIVERVGNRRLFLWSFLVATAFVLLATPLPATGWQMLWGFFAGLAFGPFFPILNVAMQTLTPSHLRGRVVGLLTAVQYAAGPVGFLLIGPLVDQLGASRAYLVLGVAMGALSLIAFLLPTLRGLDDLPRHVDEPLPLEDSQPPHPLT